MKQQSDKERLALLEEAIACLEEENLSLRKNLHDLEEEFKENERSWEYFLEEKEIIFQKSLFSLKETYEEYLIDLIRHNPSLALTSSHELIRLLAKEILEKG